jgi:GTP:adenosylcobinamide-phosphate guanylyltransferase
LVTIAFSAVPVDPFFNINTPGDLAKAETLLAMLPPADNVGAGSLGKP